MTVPDVFHALDKGTIHREDAIELLQPPLDRILAFQLIPIAGEVIEEVSDLMLPLIATALVDGHLKRRKPIA